MDNNILMQNLCKQFEDFSLDNVSFKVPKGRIVGFIGENGAGKTTTLKMLSGLIYPSEGEIKVKGFVPHKLKNDYLREIGLVMGNKSQLWWDTSSYDSFELEGQIYGLDSKTISDRVEYLSELLDVKELLRTPVRKLSLGERMKMEFILVLLHEPSILFLDEPTNDLDIQTLQILEDYLDTFNGALITVSHDRYFLDRICDKLFVFKSDKTIQQFLGGYSALMELGEKNTVLDKNEKAVKPKVSPRLTSKEKQELEMMDEHMEKLQKQIEAIDEQMEMDTQDFVKLQSLSEEREALETKMEELMERWEYLSEKQQAIEDLKKGKSR